MPFPGHVGCSGVTKKQVAGKGEETPGEAAEQGSHPFKAWAALSRRRSKQKPPCEQF